MFNYPTCVVNVARSRVSAIMQRGDGQTTSDTLRKSGNRERRLEIISRLVTATSAMQSVPELLASRPNFTRRFFLTKFLTILFKKGTSILPRHLVEKSDNYEGKLNRNKRRVATQRLTAVTIFSGFDWKISGRREEKFRKLQNLEDDG